MIKRLMLTAAAAALLSTPALAARIQPPPQPAAPTPAIAAPRDVPYPGLLKLSVDATDLDHRIFRVRETIPVARSGPVTLLFPMWLPGAHSARGELNHFAGLIVTAGGKRIEWTRDPVEVSAFHLNVPTGAKTLELEFQYLSPTAGDQGRIVVTPEMMNVQWNNLALYPAGYFTRQVQIQADIKLPTGWDYATGLETASKSGDTVSFKPISFDNLVDSPMFAGRWFKKIELDPGGRSRITLDVMADDPSLLETKPEQVQALRDLVVQADRLYGARHFDHYDLMLALTDRMGGIGLEHQRSSENGSVPKFFTDWEHTAPARNVLPHEFTHSWNGKYRRPADLWTPNFNTPMRGNGLWVYEGQTQYWGYVLGGRAAIVTRQETLDAIAAIAAAYDVREGRSWRQLIDTTNDPIVASRRPFPFLSWQRSEDYYNEGLLIWLDADTLIREQSKGAKSLDDFAKAFFGVNDGDWSQLTYDFDEVVRTLNGVMPYDWASFLKTRLEGHGPAPLDGLTRGGWKLVYTETPTDYYKNTEARARSTDLTYSIGLTVGRDGDLTGVQWEGPAFKAGLTVGTRLIAVNGLAYDADRLKAVVAATKGGAAPLELIVRTGERYRAVKLAYVGGHRYPRLERIAGAPDRLGDILTAKGQ